jgi:hypothetical protein
MEKLTINIDSQEQKKLSILAKSHKMSVPRLIRTWIEKEINEAGENVAKKKGLGDLLSSVTLKRSYRGLNSDAAMQRILNDNNNRTSV